MKKSIFYIIIGILIGFICIKVKIENKEVTKQIQDKFIIGDRSGQPYFYIITKDSLGVIEQHPTNVEDYAIYKIGHTYYFNSIEISIK